MIAPFNLLAFSPASPRPRQSTPFCPSGFCHRPHRTMLKSLPFLFALLLTGQSAPPATRAPQTLLFSATTLAEARARLAIGDQGLRPAFTALLAEANAALDLRPPSVMDKPRPAASGDKHDYFSLGPYWWPDPTKPDGLPYIRRDGVRNSSREHETDDAAFTRVCLAVESLGLGYWFTQDERYAAKAATLVRVWFLDAATRMNPNFQHAQAIPGITDGRGIGIIESRRLLNLNEGLVLLGDSPAWTAGDRTALKGWLAAFYAWLRTSANGRDEQNEHNNHGTWYDAQAAYLALVLQQPDDARAILREGLTRRLAAQVEPDGSQPHELARTKSMDYSIFNLEALLVCARLAGRIGIDWWGYTSPDGRSLHAALAFLAPYADPAMTWPRSDLHQDRRNQIIPQLAVYLQHRDDPGFRALHDAHATTLAADARSRLTGAPDQFTP